MSTFLSIWCHQGFLTTLLLGSHQGSRLHVPIHPEFMCESEDLNCTKKPFSGHPPNPQHSFYLGLWGVRRGLRDILTSSKSLFPLCNSSTKLQESWEFRRSYRIFCKVVGTGPFGFTSCQGTWPMWENWPNIAKQFLQGRFQGLVGRHFGTHAAAAGLDTLGQKSSAHEGSLPCHTQLRCEVKCDAWVIIISHSMFTFNDWLACQCTVLTRTIMYETWSNKIQQNERFPESAQNEICTIGWWSIMCTCSSCNHGETTVCKPQFAIHIRHKGVRYSQN